MSPFVVTGLGLRGVPNSREEAASPPLSALFLLTFLQLTGAPLYLQRYGIQPNFWLLLVVAALMPVFLKSRDVRFYIRPVAVWAYAYGVVALGWVFINKHFSSALDSALRFVMFGIVLIAFYSLFSTGKACLVARRAVLFATLTSMCLNFYEFFFPGAFSGVPGRSAGLFLNPNTSGTAMTFGMILSRHLVPVRFRLLYELGIGVAVLSTFSRGAILCWTLAFLLGRLANFGDPGQARNLIFLAAGVGLLYWFTPLGTEINHRIDAESGTSGLAYSRLTFSDSDESLYDSRFSVASAAWESFQQHPLFGTGTGTASFQYGEIALGPHNMFLSLMVQFGATGLLLITSLFVILIVNVLHRRLAIEFTLVLALAAFFSHTLLLQWHYALLIALVYNTSRVPGIREATAVASSETTAHSNQKISMALLGSNRGNPPCRNTISVGCSPQFVTENQRSWIQ